MSFVRVLALLATFGSCSPLDATATAMASSDLAFSNLTIGAGESVPIFVDVWTLQAFASTNNSLGGSDVQFNAATSPGSTSAAASVTWATASSAAGAAASPANANVTGNAGTSASIPGSAAGAAFSTGIGTLSNSFTLSGTAPLNVAFGIDLAGALDVLTDALGLLAFTETIFTLQVDGTTVLFYDQPLQIGPSDAQSQVVSTHLANSIVLDPGVSHFLLLEIDSEAIAQTIPEPSTAALLLIGAMALCLAKRKRTVFRAV